MEKRNIYTLNQETSENKIKYYIHWRDTFSWHIPVHVGEDKDGCISLASAMVLQNGTMMMFWTKKPCILT